MSVRPSASTVQSLVNQKGATHGGIEDTTSRRILHITTQPYLEKVRPRGIVADQVAKRSKLSPADIVITAHGRDPEVVEAGLAQIT